MTRGFKERRQKPYAGKTPAKGARGAATPAPPEPPRARVTLGPGGRFVIPKKLRQAMEVEVGDSMTAKVVDGELRVMGSKAGLRKVQEMIARRVPPGVSLVDELLKDRRREVEKDEREVREETRRWRQLRKGDG